MCLFCSEDPGEYGLESYWCRLLCPLGWSKGGWRYLRTTFCSIYPTCSRCNYSVVDILHDDEDDDEDDDDDDDDDGKQGDPMYLLPKFGC